ncbi:DUF4244 domain-containing protein [Rhodococcus sp. T2V]|uniref:DUF4244 domain-containing protein n=1 Tax=Rhodococcus sp. T2V TaxID=3034164 RepID=UPI0023E132B3|nr:DUF4244 domain-containing protein [Rhodococcus sp. T2V]MDF3305615.1 DUF4244 domain-containing protein [Rhodococcus sp. T2V]
MKHGIRSLAAVRALTAHFALLATDEDGMSTAEYAIGTIAAAAFGAVLYSVVTECQLILSSHGRRDLLPDLAGPRRGRPWGRAPGSRLQGAR